MYEYNEIIIAFIVEIEINVLFKRFMLLYF